MLLNYIALFLHKKTIFSDVSHSLKLVIYLQLVKIITIYFLFIFFILWTDINYPTVQITFYIL